MTANSPSAQPDRLYVIGDIHGRSDLLDRMIDEISRDLAAKPVAESLTVTLGDYVDRGPDSRDVRPGDRAGILECRGADRELVRYPFQN